MAKLKGIYKCKLCRNVVEVLHEGPGELFCCGKPMNYFEVKTEDKGREKHVPVIEKLEKGVKVKVGEIPHPMEESHYIEWIELKCCGCDCRTWLSPGGAPEAKFACDCGNYKARIYCNLHGVWES